jgi:ferritin-like metal-binding protein YciE
MAKEATDAGVKAAIEHHLQETKEQIDNLEQIFASMGTTARGQKCPGILGLLEEHNEFVAENEDAPSAVMDAFLCGAGSRVEHYEIAAYTGLVDAARALNRPDAANLLEANLNQERAMLEETTSAHSRIVRSPATTM